MQACKNISILTYYIIDSWYGYIQSPVVSDQPFFGVMGGIPDVNAAEKKEGV